MALTINSDPLSNQANAYADIAFAQSYFEARVHSSTWNGTNVDTQKAALIQATRFLDRFVEWKGQIKDVEQPLLWPRLYVKRKGRQTTGFSSYPQVYFSLDSYFDPDAEDFPLFLREACCEIALTLLPEDRLADSDSDGLAGISVEGVSLRWFKDRNYSDIFSQAVRLMIIDYGRPVLKHPSSVRLVRS